MRIIQISIENFRSIHHLEKLNLESDITTFVGANEHGKSNILSAINFLDAKVKFSDKDRRVDSNGDVFNPKIHFLLRLDNAERQKILDALIAKFPHPLTKEEVNPVEKPIKVYSLKDVPEEFVYSREYDGTESTYQTELEDEEVEGAVYELIKKEGGSKVIFFDDFTDRLKSSITKDEINNFEKNLIIRGLLKVSGLLGYETQIFSNDKKTGKLFELAPQNLTREVKKNWFQGNDKNDNIIIKLIRSYGSDELFVQVEDKNTFVDFDSRSRGFKWFLSFFLKYRAYHDGDLTDAIFIMDEPGLFLHPKGQKDLLNYIEKLGKKNQIIYSTHSPFMINRLNQKRVRVVEKKFDKGTVINAKGFTANWRHLRTSLGIVLADSFYFADKTLIVEGPEDVIFITSLLKCFIESKGMEVDVNLLSILSAGGAANLYPMVQIVKDEERPLIVLVDSDSKKILNRLEKGLKKNEFSEISKFNSDAVSIQDLLPKKLYQDAVNRYIEKIITDGSLKLSKGKNKQYTCTTNNRRDKEVVDFIVQNFDDVDENYPISKVGIAREFEELLSEHKPDGVEWKHCSDLVNWVVESLDLKLEF